MVLTTSLPQARSNPRSEEIARRNQALLSSGFVRSDCVAALGASYSLRRCRSLECLFPGSRRRDAGGRDPGGQPGPAQGLRHRHLLGGGKSVRSPNRLRPPGSRRSAHPSRSMARKEKTAAPKVRDRLCQVIRQHQLDASLVKSYAVDFCATGAA